MLPRHATRRQHREPPARVDELTKSLGLDADQVIPFSAHTGAGRDDLAAAIVSLTEPEAGAPADVP